LMGLDETSHPFLITIAFLGGAVSYSRGHFIAITLLVERAPPVWREFLGASVEWLVILIAALIGAYSVPLLIANAEEKTVLLGISYAWLTLPMTIGSALFVLHAGRALLRRSLGIALTAMLTLAALVALFWLSKG